MVFAAAQVPRRWPGAPAGMMTHLTSVLTKIHSLNRAYSPIPILKRLRIVGKQFRLGRQEDSHEFLRCLLEAVDRHELRVSHSVSP